MEKNKVGFTLIEIVVTVAIIIAIISIVGFHISGRKKIVIQECKQIAEAMNEYYHNTGSYPSNLKAFLNNKDYFSSKLRNPYGDGFDYTISGNIIKVYAKGAPDVYYEFKESQMEVSP